MSKTRYPKGPRIKVHVSEEQIVFAKGRDSSHCMISEAIRASMPGARFVSTDLQTIRITDPEKPLRYTYLTPRTAIIALIRFDRGDKDIEPFSFELRGAHVTSSGQRRRLAPLDEGDQDAVKRHENAVKAAKVSAELRKTRIIDRDKGTSGTVPDRVGGQPPPLMKVGKNPVPFARRRAYGLRALER